MSSKLFKGNLGKGETDRGAGYKAGERGPEMELATEVAEFYLSGKLEPDQTKPVDDRDTFNRSLDTIFKELKGHDLKSLDHFLFLDMLLQRLGQATDFLMLGHVHCLIDPLVQLLYWDGHNNFSIDLLSLPARPTYCGSFLTGEPNRILTASFAGEKVNDFAYDSRYSKLSYTGEAMTVGYNSISVVTLFDGVSGSVGWRSHGSEYELIGDGAKINQYGNRDCIFKVESEEAYDSGLRHFSEVGFFRRGNRILMSDGKGGWDEVKPR